MTIRGERHAAPRINHAFYGDGLGRATLKSNFVTSFYLARSPFSSVALRRPRLDSAILVRSLMRNRNIETEILTIPGEPRWTPRARVPNNIKPRLKVSRGAGA